MTIKFDTDTAAHDEVLIAAFGSFDKIPPGIKVAGFHSDHIEYTAIFVPAAFPMNDEGWFNDYFSGQPTAAGFPEGTEEISEFKAGLYFFIGMDYGPCTCCSVAGYIPQSGYYPTEEELERIAKIVYDATEYVQDGGDVAKYEEMMKAINGQYIEFTDA